MRSELTIDKGYSIVFRDGGLSEKDYFLAGIKSDSRCSYYECMLYKRDQLLVEFQVALNSDGVAQSLPKTPFGGIWIHHIVNSEVFSDFLKSILSFVKEKGGAELIITQASCLYSPHSDTVQYFLQKEGFELVHAQNHHFFEGKKKLKAEQKLLSAKYNKKLKENGLKVSVGNIQSFNFLNEIKAWNQSRGYKISFDENQLISQVSAFPERYFVISVIQGVDYIGHALAVKLTSKSIYYFLSAINPKTKVKLAGELIMVNLIKLAVEQKASFVDFGSSEVEGVPNHSLIFFKSKFSNCTRNKYTWKRQL